jgi:hypothetical protein
VQLVHYLGLLHQSELELADALRQVAADHAGEPDVQEVCLKLALDSVSHAERLQPFAERYGEEADDEPERLHSELFRGTRSGGLGLLRDLHDLYMLACACDISWTLVGQAAQGARDPDLLSVVRSCEGETAIACKWLTTRMKAAAPQALVAG